MFKCFYTLLTFLLHALTFHMLIKAVFIEFIVLRGGSTQRFWLRLLLSKKLKMHWKQGWNKTESKVQNQQIDIKSNVTFRWKTKNKRKNLCVSILWPQLLQIIQQIEKGDLRLNSERSQQPKVDVSHEQWKRCSWAQIDKVDQRLQSQFHVCYSAWKGALRVGLFLQEKE